MVTPPGIILVLIIIAAVLTFLMPFFVLKIRNQAVDMNKKLSRVVQLLESQTANKEIQGPRPSTPEPRKKYDKKGRDIVTCTRCGQKNRGEDLQCISCGEALFKI